MTIVLERRSGPARGRPDTTSTVPERNPAPAEPPTARAVVFPATGRRTLDVAVVSRCPWCRRAGHVHRGLDLDGAVRESGCTPRREYQLAVRR